MPVRLEFQVLDIKETPISLGHGCTGGVQPRDWSWLADPDAVRRHVGSYGLSRIPDKNQAVGILLTGTTASGHSVGCWVKFYRSFRVEVDESVNVGELLAAVGRKMYDKSPINYTVERKPRRYGWKSDPSDPRSPKRYKIVRVKAPTAKRYGQLVWAFKNADLESTIEIHEEVGSVPTELQAICDTGVNYGAWIEVPAKARSTRQLTTDYELCLDSFKDVKVDTERLEIAPFAWAAIDIECDSPSGRFPSPEEPDCKIIMIGVAARRQHKTERMLLRLARGEKSQVRHVDPIKAEKHLDVYTEHTFDTEVELLWALWEAIMILDYRMLVTFNGDRFDWKYILRRVYHLDMDVNRYLTLGNDLFQKWADVKVGRGRDAYMMGAVEASEDKQNAVVFNVQGRIGLDLRYLFQKTLNGVPRYRFKRYALDPVAERLLGAHKIDVPAKEMFRIWKEGTPEELRRFCDYCIVDVQLLVDMIDKEEIISQLVAMADTSHTCVHDIVNVGQYRKVENAITVNASKLGAFTNNKLRTPDIDFKGATVVEPICGAHGTVSEATGRLTGAMLDNDALDPMVGELITTVLSDDEKRLYKVDQPVGTLDFASLYPSIIMSYLMCIFLVILPGKQGDSKVERAHRRKPVPEDELRIHEEIVYEDDDPSKPVLRRHRFVQNAREPFRQGIIPKWQAELKKNRKFYKRKMKECPEMTPIYNARQLALKISMNSVYGVYKIICAAIAEAITNQGRFMLAQVIKRVNQLGLTVVYGDTDSVMVRSPRGIESFDKAWEFFEKLETQLNQELFSGEGNVNALEFEKLAEFFLLLGKKAYFMYKKEKIDEPFVLSSTGTCDVRRDRPAILTDLTILLGKIMVSCRHLAIEATGKVVLEAVRRHFEGMVDNSWPVQKYAVSTTIQTINEVTEKKAHMVLARRLEQRDGVSFTVGDSIEVVQVVGDKKLPDAEKVAAPADLKSSRNVDRFLYFKKKVIDQVRKMARFYLPEETMALVVKEYSGALKPKLGGSIYSMLGGNEKNRRKRLFSESFQKHTKRLRLEGEE